MGSTRYPIVESLSDRSVTVARSRSAGGSDRTRRVGDVGEQLDHCGGHRQRFAPAFLSGQHVVDERDASSLIGPAQFHARERRRRGPPIGKNV